MFRVIHEFADLQDKEHVYHAGDPFPREGLEVSENRLTELLKGANRIGVPLIEFVANTAEKTPVEVEYTADPGPATDPVVEPEPAPEPKPKPRRGRRKTNAD